MFSNHTKGWVIKSVNYSVASMTNGYNTDSGNIATNGDDQLLRHVIGVICSDHTANVRTQINVQSKKILDIDNSSFSPTAGPLDLDYTINPGQYLDIQPLNASGGTISNASWTIFYEVLNI